MWAGRVLAVLVAVPGVPACPAAAQQLLSSSSVQLLGSSSAVPVTVSPGQPILLANEGDSLLLGDVTAGTVKRIDKSGIAAPVTLVSGLRRMTSLSVDPAKGDVYITDSTLDHLIEIPAGSTTAQSFGSGLLQASGATVDPGSNVIVADAGNNRIVTFSPSGAAVVLASQIPSLTTVFSDAQGVLYAGAQSTLLKFTGAASTPVASGWSLPSSITEDESGNLFVLDTGSHQLVEVVLATATKQSVAVGAGLVQPAALCGDGDGTLFVYDQGNATLNRLTVDGKLKAGAVAVGAASRPYTLTYRFIADTTLAHVLTLTEGSADGQLQASGGSCVMGHLYRSGDSCTVVLEAKPLESGSWQGDVTLVDAAGEDLLDTEVFATGSAPALSLLPGIAQTYYRKQYSYLGELIPSALAVDSANNVYIGDDANSEVLEVAPNGDTSVLLSGSDGNSGLRDPLAFSLDGKGDLFVADQSYAWFISPALGASASLQRTVGTAVPYQQWGYSNALVSTMTGLLVQRNGGFYFSDSTNNRVISVDTSGNGTEILNASTTIGSENLGLNYPMSLAYDTDGSLLVADAGNNRIVRRTAGGRMSDVVAPGASLLGKAVIQPMGMVVDPAGNLYFSDEGNNRILGLTPQGAAWVILDETSQIDGSNALPLSDPQSLALDAAGNLYIADIGNERIVKVNRSTANLFFNQTNPGNQSAALQVVVENTGNQPLGLQSLAFGSSSTDFALNGSTTCTSHTTLAVNSSCGVSVDYAPTRLGSSVNQLTILSNSQNVPATQAVVNLSGASQVAVNDLRVTAMPASVAAGSSFSYTLRAEDTHASLVSGYTGTVLLTWTDTAIHSLTYTFTAADGGTHTFLGVIPHTAGIATLSAGDTGNSTLTTTASVLVGAGAPHGLSVITGSGQSANILAAFGQPLAVAVTDAYGNVVPGAIVTFAGPASGASAEDSSGDQAEQVATDGTGSAYAYLTANGTGGSYAVVATLANGAAVQFSLTNIDIGFGLAATASSISFNAAGTANATLQVTPASGFTGTIAFTCTAQSGITCSFSDSSLEVQAASPGVPVTVNIQTTSVSAAGTSATSAVETLAVLATLAGFFGIGRTRQYRAKLLACLVVLLGAGSFGIIGCGTSAATNAAKTPAPASVQVQILAQTKLPGTGQVFQRNVVVTVNPVALPSQGGF